jgi:hypothetical protein
MGIGDWGLGIGDWPNPQSPIPNPQSPIPNPQISVRNCESKIKMIFSQFLLKSICLKNKNMSFRPFPIYKMEIL